MSAREWLDKDFYAELGVSSDASADEIKKSYRKLARENHPDANPGNSRAEAKFKAVSEAYGVLSDPEKRKQYDEARRLFGAGFGSGQGGGGFGGFGAGTGTGGFDLGDLFGGAQAGGGIGDLFGGLFGNRRGGATSANRPRRGADVETEVTIDFTESVRGATVPLRLSSPATCATCHGSGARPGTRPHSCATCAGAGLVTRNQGAFAFSEPCPDCRGRGQIIDDPCPECRGEGVSTRTRTLTVRIPQGVSDGQRIRLAGQGEPGRHGAAAGDLYVVVHVNPHRVFGRSGSDLTITVPVTFPELTLGTTLTVPTLDGKVSLKVQPGTSSGRTLRVRGKGVEGKSGSRGDLLVTLQVAVPSKLDGKAEDALRAYAEATADHDPRGDLDELLGR
ncbi:molecular chaperone DnaJ [Saccharopolyspora erythraea NRRL 2338]|uniref:Chaperone protein DnaJ n=1 Tax=Saccharopolyspora erythraea (strain ATCC 11635 / DSM 40517 / JCM 4748 / NBRC 13426 / NCIMB 8594 / NRRL 2338) TaxID=405948 RepID=A4FQP1_SACEN|nr:molecular chaperone DnaJ [Saccharopolyspora erythraea]EQD87677.1 molecular chaperone DnaJ [Saccharopolyspora erythraea D]PFG92968.1 molecular chaperone DnaJ [Saccharopolyspora erythraea NRRL 2338]QRK89860.1 molecular chaperone DnaJ [Saccharopolyspora erythraea]CAM06366.1 molecular chaperone [Saccharopolyspora erythraea NRRL 2338]